MSRRVGGGTRGTRRFVAFAFAASLSFAAAPVQAASSGTLSCMPRPSRRPSVALPAAAAPQGTLHDGLWCSLDATPPEGLAACVAIRDTRRERTVVYDATNACLWELTAGDPARWARIDARGAWPSPRTDESVAYDAANDRMLMFGGRVDPSGAPFHGWRELSAELWALEFSPEPRWTLLADDAASGGSTLARASAAFAVDAVGNRVIVCGGQHTYEAASDVWAFGWADAGAGWQALAPAGTLNARLFAPSAVFDDVRRRLLAIGYTGFSPNADVWSLELSEAVPRWRQLTTAPPRPAYAFYPYWATWDSRHDRLLAFNGGGSSSYYSAPDGVWAWTPADSSRWTTVSAAGDSPPFRVCSALVWDAPRHACVAVDGDAMEAWAFDPDARTWRQLVGVTTTVPADGLASMLYMAGRDQFVTWRGAWRRKPGRDAVWSPFPTRGSGPRSADGSSAAYDTRRDRAIVFGGELNLGNGEYSYLKDLWSVSLAAPGASWTKMAPLGDGPPGGDASSVIYDPERDRLIVFGGLGNWTDDTWELSLADPPRWAKLTTHVRAPYRFDATAVYDAPRRRMLIVGGADGDWATSNQIWALSLDDTVGWSQLPAGESAPRPRAAAAVAFDAVRDRLLVWAGTAGSDLLDDLWEYSLAPGGGWRRLMPLGAAPAHRIFASAVFDPRDDCLMLYGGESGEDFEGRTFFSAHPRLSALYFDGPFDLAPSVERDGANVRVRWHVQRGAARHATVWRQGGVGGAVALGAAARLDDTTFAAIDTEAEPGQSYTYTLRRENPADTCAYGAVAVHVPPVMLGVRVPAARRGATLECVVTLAAPGAAAFDIVDARGRSLAHEELSGGRPGARTVRVEGSARWPRGVYVARVSQAGQTSPPARFLLAP